MNGAYCPVARAIVPMHDEEPCEWCDVNHPIQYAYEGRWVLVK